MWTYRELKFKARGVLIKCFTKSLLAVLICNLITNLPALFLNLTKTPDVGTMTQEEIIKIQTAIMNNFNFAVSVVLGMILIFLLFSVFIASPLRVGRVNFFNKAIEGEAKIKNLFLPFMSGAGVYFRILKVTFMKSVFVALWGIAGSIPSLACLYFTGNIYVSAILLLTGMILPVFKSYQYFMVDYIAADNPDTKCRAAIRQSKEMMRGRIFYALGLTFSFIGWYFVSMLYGGIGAIFISPYIELTFSVLYFALKDEYLQETEENEHKNV